MSLSFQFEAARDALAGEPTKRRPKRIRTLGSLELEAKVALVAAEQVTEMIARIREQSDGICKASTREQFHTVFATDASGYHGLVLVEGSDYMGVRSKNTGELIASPSLRIPTYVRDETAVTPSDENYTPYLRHVLLSRKIGSFDKRCADVAFWVNNNSFTATVSIVDRPDMRSDGCYQLELEFDGHRKETAPPAIAKIWDDFERAYHIAFGEQQPSTVTKLEWIAAMHGHEDILPRYEQIHPDQSVLLARRDGSTAVGSIVGQE